MTSSSLRHSIDKFHEYVKPEYVKKVNESLSVSLTFIEDSQPDQTIQESTTCECLISFHNVDERGITVNETDESSLRQTESNDSGWFGGFFGTNSNSSDSRLLVNRTSSENEDLTIFLGYIQVVGYVVLNYKFGLNSSTSAIDSGKSAHWWENKDYIYNYKDADGEDGQYEDEKAEKLDQVPYIKENLAHPLVVGGKLGGVSDLIVEHGKSSNHWIDEKALYYVHDLLYPFNSRGPPNFNQNADLDGTAEIKIPVKELSDSIIPFYSTSQSLLFTDLHIPPKSTKTFHIKFPRSTDLPPTYNARLTGPVCDQGLVSIKYSLIVSLLQSSGSSMDSRSIYFPLSIKGERIGSNERYMQRDYFESKSKIDKNWQVEVIEEEEAIEPPVVGNVSESLETREAFFEDISKLIKSDLYNMPKMSTNERKKSIHSLESWVDDVPVDGKYVPQLPSHLKTQFQLRVNNNQLCQISLSRPYYHVGEDINFILDINPEEHSLSTKVVGFIAHLEAHEIFHTNHSSAPQGKENSEAFTNTYRVSGNIKYNTFMPSLANSILPDSEQRRTLINGSINIPRHLSQQFQSSSFMDLKYFIVFKFNLNQFSELLEEVNEEGNGTEANGTTGHNPTELVEESADVEASLLTTSSIVPTDSVRTKIDAFRANNFGTELRFRLPLYVLP